MKLLRAYHESTNAESRWLNRSDDDILIKPNSKISLVNANVKYNSDEIEIFSDNNNLQFSTSKKNQTVGNINTITLDDGFYNPVTLMRELESEMNAGFNIAYDGTPNKNTGFDWRATLTNDENGDSFVNLKYKRANFKVADRVASYNSSNISKSSGVSGGDEYTKPAGSGSDLGAFWVTDFPFVNGCGTVEMDLINITSSNIALGFMQDTPDKSGTANPSQYIYAINIKSTGNVDVISNITGTLEVLSDVFTVINTDTINFQLSEGNMSVLKNGSVQASSVKSWKPVNYSPNVNYFVGILQDQTASVEFLTYNKYGFDTGSIDGITRLPTELRSFDNNFGEYDALGNLTDRPSLVRINFTDSDLFRLLGYENNILEQSGFTINFKANNPINLETRPNNLLVLINNLPLESFDFNENQEVQRPIVAVIPKQFDLGGEIAYTPLEQSKIDINNEGELNLKTLDISILNGEDSGNNQIPMERANLTFAIYDENGI